MKKTIEEVLLKATEGVAKMGSISQPKLQVLASTHPVDNPRRHPQPPQQKGLM